MIEYKTTEKQRAYAKEYARQHASERKEREQKLRATPEWQKKQSDYGREYRRKNAARVKEQDRLEYARNKASGATRIYLLKKNYGITLEQHDAMLAEQNNGCAICGNGPSGKSSRWFHVDHDHDSGKVRALLCAECNTALGKFRDSPELLDKAAAYLRKHGK